MSVRFEDRITAAGRDAIQDLIDLVAQDLKQTREAHGADSIEAASLGLILANSHFVMGEYRKADPLVRNYIYVAEENYGSNSEEVLCGLILLSNNCIGWGRLEDSRCVLERVKFVRQRCSSSRDSILEGLYDFAERCHSSEDPTNKQRGFILFLLALSWCVRYSREEHVYKKFAPRLKTVFESHGFVEERWEWLVERSKSNLNDLVGLISILLESRIFPLESMLPFTAYQREESLNSLIRDFPVNKESLNTVSPTTEIVFMCPRCGSRDLRTKFPEALYQVSTLDAIKIDPNVDCDPWYIDEREPSEYEGVGHTDEWEFWCDKCRLVPDLDLYEEEERQDESLARWLLDNCPQSPERHAVTGSKESQD